MIIANLLWLLLKLGIGVMRPLGIHRLIRVSLKSERNISKRSLLPFVKARNDFVISGLCVVLVSLLLLYLSFERSFFLTCMTAH